jgi:hypothetical protein
MSSTVTHSLSDLSIRDPGEIPVSDSPPVMSPALASASLPVSTNSGGISVSDSPQVTSPSHSLADPPISDPGEYPVVESSPILSPAHTLADLPVPRHPSPTTHNLDDIDLPQTPLPSESHRPPSNNILTLERNRPAFITRRFFYSRGVITVAITIRPIPFVVRSVTQC